MDYIKNDEKIAGRYKSSGNQIKFLRGGGSMGKCTLIDLTNQKFGKLVVLEKDQIKTKSGNAKWICQCECGNEVSVIGSHLRSGHTSSCGCNRISNIAQGHAKERIYRTWKKMHIRCSDPNSDRYKWYGGKGIEVCNQWSSFIEFRSWAYASGYDDTLTIDRINSEKNYSPDNCRWVDMKVQANNRTSNKIVYFEGKEYTVTELAEEKGMLPSTIFNRLKLGWTINRTINTPERSCS